MNCGSFVDPNSPQVHLAICDKISVKCRATYCGCNWIGPRSQIQKHESDCCFVVKSLSIFDELHNQLCRLKFKLDATVREMKKLDILCIKYFKEYLNRLCKGDHVDVFDDRCNAWKTGVIIVRKRNELVIQTSDSRLVKKQSDWLHHVALKGIKI